MDTPIPEKRFFRIGEVAKIAGLKPYVIRYWETEFRGLKPLKTGAQRRVYQRRDVELILRIKELLYVERYTIEGARKLLQGESGKQESPPINYQEILKEIKEELTNLKERLK